MLSVLAVVFICVAISSYFSLSTSKIEFSVASSVNSDDLALPLNSHFRNGEYTLEEISKIYKNFDCSKSIPEKIKCFFDDLSNFYLIRYYSDIGDYEKARKLSRTDQEFIAMPYVASYDFSHYKIYSYCASNRLWDISFLEITADSLVPTSHSKANKNAVSMYRFSVFSSSLLPILMCAIAIVEFSASRNKSEKHIVATDVGRNVIFWGRLLFCIVWSLFLFTLFSIVGLSIGKFDFSARMYTVEGLTPPHIIPVWSALFIKASIAFVCGLLLVGIAAFGSTLGERGIPGIVVPLFFIITVAVIFFKNCEGIFLTGLNMTTLSVIPLFGSAYMPMLYSTGLVITVIVEIVLASIFIIFARNRSAKTDILQ